MSIFILATRHEEQCTKQCSGDPFRSDDDDDGDGDDGSRRGNSLLLKMTIGFAHQLWLHNIILLMSVSVRVNGASLWLLLLLPLKIYITLCMCTLSIKPNAKVNTIGKCVIVEKHSLAHQWIVHTNELMLHCHANNRAAEPNIKISVQCCNSMYMHAVRKSVYACSQEVILFIKQFWWSCGPTQPFLCRFLLYQCVYIRYRSTKQHQWNAEHPWVWRDFFSRPNWLTESWFSLRRFPIQTNTM